MEIFVAKTAGFCFGVNRAVKMTYKIVNEDKKRDVVTLGPVIHNSQVVKDLEDKGAKVVNSKEELILAKDNDTKPLVVIRAHGIKPGEMQELASKGFDIVDTTCPDVKKIHRYAEEYYKKGYQIIIVGDPEHPEVIGISGCCDDKAIILNHSDFDDSVLDSINQRICVVAQTTITREKWESVTLKILARFPDAVLLDTICNATAKRQKEAEEIAAKADVMLVIGGKNSSNTQKLYELSKNLCEKTFIIETAAEIPPLDVNNIEILGITAGASTPDWIIKEVIENMEELNKGNYEMSFKEAFESSMVTLNSGEIVKGKIIGFNNSEVYVDLGYKSDGIIPMKELTDDPEAKPENMFKTGDEIEVYIVRVNDGEGNVLLSKKKVDSIKGWDKVEAAFESKVTIEAKVVEVVNGGVIALAGGVRVFIPASQVSDRYTKNLSDFLKAELPIRILDLDKRKRRVVGSHKVVAAEQREKAKTEVWGTIEVGKKYKGTVKRITDFGAFVDIGGVDGLVHVSELSWSKIKHPSEVLKEGDIVEVYVMDLDKEKGRISLGYKKTEENPWKKIEEKYKAGDIIKGKVARMVPFGVFVEIEPGVDGLVHISQISDKRIAKPADVLSIGQTVEAKIVEMNIESQKVSLSIKEVNPINPKSSEKDEAKEASGDTADLPTEYKEDDKVTIGEMLNTPAEVNEVPESSTANKVTQE